MMPSDRNQVAALTVKLATEDAETSPSSNLSVSQYLATIGRKGGIKGGKARANALSAKRRKEIARNAAISRWAEKDAQD